MKAGEQKGQQAILDAIAEYGFIRCHTDWRTGRRFITTGKGHHFDARSFDALVRKNLIVVSNEKQYSHMGIKYVLAATEG